MSLTVTVKQRYQLANTLLVVALVIVMALRLS